jgi:hypothetical protein
MGNAMFTIIAATREESGSITPMEWRAARQISFRTTILALNIRPSMVSNWRPVRVLKTDGQGGNQRGEHADPQPRQLARDAQRPSLKQGEAASVLLADAGAPRALHLCDCILVLEPGAEGGPIAACLWNGFGLHLVDDPATVARREALLGAGQRGCAPSRAAVILCCHEARTGGTAISTPVRGNDRRNPDGAQ